MKQATLATVLLASFFLLGCGDSGPNTGGVKGTVTYKGEILKGGRLNFYNSKNEIVGGTTLSATGTYEASDLPKEDLKVTVVTDTGMGMGNMQTAAPPGTPVIPSTTGVPVPEKYHKAETTDLSVKITSKGQKADFKLE
jgi:hypothetical protein